LLLLVPLASLAFRRGWVLCLFIFLSPVPQSANAFEWDDLWKTADQQGRALLADGNATEAAAKFDDPLWEAVARYRAAEFEGSAQRFSGHEDADSLYNFGNALARMGELEPAIDAYERALELDPEVADAAYNRDLLKDTMEQQDSQDGEQGDEQSSEEGGGGQQSEGESDSDQSGEEGADGDAGSESDAGDESAREQEMNEEDLAALERELERAAREAEQQAGDGEEERELSEAQAEAQRRAQEQQQAMEQWLRRIPNDPGGLLRRKFRYQYQRQGHDQDGNNLWPDDEVQPW
jgi:Ca-activated chloride channel family protein